jgi:hypothetical protein
MESSSNPPAGRPTVNAPLHAEHGQRLDDSIEDAPEPPRDAARDLSSKNFPGVFDQVLTPILEAGQAFASSVDVIGYRFLWGGHARPPQWATGICDAVIWWTVFAFAYIHCDELRALRDANGMAAGRDLDAERYVSIREAQAGLRLHAALSPQPVDRRAG